MARFLIDIEARFAQMQDALNQISRATDRSAQQMERAFRRVNIALGAVGAGFSFKAILDAGIAAERSANRLAATLRATGFAAGVTTRQIEGLVDALAKSTSFDDEGIRDAASTLLRFRDVQGDVFREALKLTLDLAAAQGGDATAAAETLGRALEDPIGGMKALRSVMPPLSAATKETIKNLQEAGDLAGAQKIVLDALAQSIGGIAGAENTGLFGATKSLSKSWDEMLETLATTPVVRDPVIATLNGIANAARIADDAVRDMASGFRDSKELLDAIAGTGPVPMLAADPEAEKAKAGQERQRLQRERDRQKLIAERNRQLQLTLTKASLDKELEIERDNLNTRLELIDTLRDQGAIGIREFYALRLSATKQASDAEIRAINATIDAIENQIAAESKLSEKRPGLEADKAKALAQRAVLVNKQNLDQIKGAVALGAALETEKRAWQDVLDPMRAVAREAGAFEGVRPGLSENEQVLGDISLKLKEIDASFQGPAAQFLDAIDPTRQYRIELQKVNAVLQSPDALKAYQAIGVTQEKLVILAQRYQRAIERSSPAEQWLQAIDPARRYKQELEDIDDLEQAGQLTREKAAKARAITDFSRKQQDLDIGFGDLEVEERRITAARKRGEITTQEALARSDAARKRSLVTLSAMADEYERLAREGGRPDLQLRADQLRVTLEELAASSNQVGDQLRLIFEDSLTDPLIDVINRTKTADQGLKAFFNNIAQSLLRLAAQNISETLFGSLFGKRSGGGADLLGSFFGLFGSRSGGAAAAGAAGGGFSGADWFGDGGIMTSRGRLPLMQYQHGGVAIRPQIAVFGERGPEAFIPLKGGAVPVSLRTGRSLQAGPSAMLGKGARPVQTSIQLQVHPSAMQMTLRDWFEGELARTAATR